MFNSCSPNDLFSNINKFLSDVNILSIEKFIINKKVQKQFFENN